MAKLPDGQAVGGGKPSSVHQDLKILRMGKIDSRTNAHLIGAGMKKLGAAVASAGASIGGALEGQQKEQDGMDLIRADSFAKAERTKLDQSFDTDPDYSTYDGRYQAASLDIRDKAAGMIRNEKLREKWVTQDQVTHEVGRTRVLDRGNARAREATIAEVDGAIDAHRSRYALARDDSERASILADMDGAIAVGEKSGLLRPADAARLRERHLEGAIYDEVDRRIWQDDPHSVLKDLDDANRYASPPASGAGRLPDASGYLRSKLAPGYEKRTSDVDNLQPGFQERLAGFVKAAEDEGHDLRVLSGHRSEERQAALWQNAVKKYGSEDVARRYVAPPGGSSHGFGLAVDLQYGDRGPGLGGKQSQAVKWAHANAEKYGLHFRLDHEDWHIEPVEVTQGGSAARGLKLAADGKYWKGGGAGGAAGGEITPALTAYSPQKGGDRMEGGYAAAKPGPDGVAEVRTLADVAAGRSKYVTLAGNPSEYGKEYTIPRISYVDGEGKRHDLTDVKGVVHDTGAAFKKAAPGRYDVAIDRDLGDDAMAASHALWKKDGVKFVDAAAAAKAGPVQVADASGSTVTREELPPAGAAARYIKLSPERRRALEHKARTALSAISQQEIKDDIERIRRTGKPEMREDGSTALDRAAKVLTPNQHSKLSLAWREAEMEHSAVTGLADMSEAEAQRHMLALNPDAREGATKDESYHSQVRVLRRAETEWKRIRLAREKDPALAVDSAPEVRAAETVVEEAMRRPDSDRAKALAEPGRALEMRAEARLEAQERLGIPEHGRRIITRAEAEHLLQMPKFGTMSDKDYLNGLKAAADRAEQIYGTRFGRRAFEEAIAFRAPSQERGELASAVARKIVSGEPVTGADVRKSERMDEATRSEGFAKPAADKPPLDEPRTPYPEEIELLKRHPDQALKFDARYGKGMAAKALRGEFDKPAKDTTKPGATR